MPKDGRCAGETVTGGERGKASGLRAPIDKTLSMWPVSFLRRQLPTLARRAVLHHHVLLVQGPHSLAGLAWKTAPALSQAQTQTICVACCLAHSLPFRYSHIEYGAYAVLFRRAGLRPSQ